MIIIQELEEFGMCLRVLVVELLTRDPFVIGLHCGSHVTKDEGVVERKLCVGIVAAPSYFGLDFPCLSVFWIFLKPCHTYIIKDTFNNQKNQAYPTQLLIWKS